MFILLAPGKLWHLLRHVSFTILDQYYHKTIKTILQQIKKATRYCFHSNLNKFYQLFLLLNSSKLVVKWPRCSSNVFCHSSINTIKCLTLFYKYYCYYCSKTFLVWRRPYFLLQLTLFVRFDKSVINHLNKR